ncbi:MAG TPA: efflux RND transporter periplasmic adaptor subunit [Paracoccus sp.]|nr:efflux RND transporter periplasmic adaptor subunit [Paracoccus sp. (in: a-proteobacteria)]
MGLFTDQKILTAMCLCLSAAARAAVGQVPETSACVILPYEIVELAVPVDGILTELSVDRGDRVDASQVVARLDAAIEDLEIAAALARAGNTAAIAGTQARLNFLEAESSRSDELVQRNVAAERSRDEARMDMETARADLEEARLARRIAEIEARLVETRRDRKTVRSPISGVVTRREAAAGEFRAAGSALMTIAWTDVLRVEAIVDITYHPAIRLGHAVTVVPEAPFDRDYEGEVTVIDQVFDAATGTFGLVAVLDNSDAALPAGLRCRMFFP